jgi:hypothetical protein
MDIIWEVEDGYVGKSRPHCLEIDDDDLAGCETEKERNDFITECVQAKFDQEISFCWEKA